jgi:hypothetical protein
MLKSWAKVRVPAPAGSALVREKPIPSRWLAGLYEL